MASTKIEYFKDGSHTQTTPDIVMSLKRPDVSQLKKWTPEQIKNVKSTLNDMEAAFIAFSIEIENALKI